MSRINDLVSMIGKSLEEQAERMKKDMKPGDYIGEDGLIYCGICHEPKQKRFEDGILAGQTHHAMCKCERERYEKEHASQQAEEKARHVEDVSSKDVCAELGADEGEEHWPTSLG